MASSVEGKKTKKKAGRVVPSRLMESTAAHRAKAVGQARLYKVIAYFACINQFLVQPRAVNMGF